MQSPRRLSDPIALKRNRERISRESLFLHEAVADDIKERLAEVNKSFTKIAAVTGDRSFWKGHFPEATHIDEGEVLALTTDTYDLLLHLMNLHWSDDPVGQLIQCRRALQPDGLLLTAFFGGQSLHELRTSIATAEAAISGGMSPRIAPMSDIREYGALLQRAGLALPVADTMTFTVTYPDLSRLMHDLRGMGEGNALAERSRKPTRRELFVEAEKTYREHFSDDSGALIATFEILVLTGWAPSDTQPKPLKPGSGKVPLSEALEPGWSFRSDEKD